MSKDRAAGPKGGASPGASASAPEVPAPGYGPVTVGLVLALAVAGPSLWGLVQAGDLDVTTALERGGLVAAGCAAGVSYLYRILASYAPDVERAHRVERLLAEIESAQDTPFALGDLPAITGAPATTDPAESPAPRTDGSEPPPWSTT